MPLRTFTSLIQAYISQLKRELASGGHTGTRAIVDSRREASAYGAL